MGWIDGPLNAPMLRGPLCGANKKHRKEYKTKHDQEIYLLLVLFKTNCERGLNLYRKIKSQIFKLMEALQ